RMPTARRPASRAASPVKGAAAAGGGGAAAAAAKAATATSRIAITRRPSTARASRPRRPGTRPRVLTTPRRRTSARPQPRAPARGGAGEARGDRRGRRRRGRRGGRRNRRGREEESFAPGALAPEQGAPFEAELTQAVADLDGGHAADIVRVPISESQQEPPR